MYDSGARIFIEVGPGAVLQGPTYDESIVKFIDAFAPID